MSIPTLLIDGHYFLHRNLKVGETIALQTSTGIPTGGVFSVIKSIRYALYKFPEARRCVVAWDHGRSVRRLSLHPEYKDNRNPKTPEDAAESETYYNIFHDQLSRLRQILPVFGIRQAVLANREGDDVLGWAAFNLEGKKVLVSDDKDILQLVGPETNVYRPRNDQLVTLENFADEVKVPKHLFLTYKALLGDISDNIPNVPGVGKTTVERVIHRMADLLPQPQNGVKLSTVLTNACALQEEADKRNKKRYRKIAENLKHVRWARELIEIRQELDTFSDDEAATLRNQMLGGSVYFQEVVALEVIRQLELTSFTVNKEGEPNWSFFSEAFRGLR